MIRENNPFYLFFNFIVSCLCIVSSYIYLYMASLRYPTDLDETKEEMLIIYIFESIFLVHMLLQFIKEYRLEDKNEVITQLLEIIINYIKTGFLIDLIPLLPFWLMKLPRQRQRLFLLLKMIRLVKGFTLFDVPKMMEVVKSGFQKNLHYIVENDEELANNREIDNNNIEEILIISYVLKIFKLIVVIMNITYLIGMIWMILCELIADFYMDIEDLTTYEDDDNDTFILTNSL